MHQTAKGTKITKSRQINKENKNNDTVEPWLSDASLFEQFVS